MTSVAYHITPSHYSHSHQCALIPTRTVRETLCDEMNGAPTPTKASDRIRYDLNPFLLATRLGHIDAPRSYAIIPDLPPSPSDSCPTLPFADPMKPTEFWRCLAEEKASRLPDSDLYRVQIENTGYWKVEALFWAQAVPKLHEDKRQRINDARYWKTESLFWQNAHQKMLTGVTRFNISDSDYWRCESLSWYTDGTKVENSNRWSIRDPKYWEIEYTLYRDVAEKVENAPQPTRPCLAELPPPPPNHRTKPRRSHRIEKKEKIVNAISRPREQGVLRRRKSRPPGKRKPQWRKPEMCLPWSDLINSGY